MNEPKNPHFVLADAQYCHVLPDRLYIGKRELPLKFPPPANHLDMVTFILQSVALLVMFFFLVMTIITSFFVVTFTIAALTLMLLVWTIRTAGFTSTKTILKDDIVGVEYKKRSFGYDFFVVRYSGPGGKMWKRRLVIYDSQRCLDQALSVMKEHGLLK